MRTRTWLYGLAGAALLGGALWWAFAPRPIPVELATATRDDFIATIAEDGKTRLVDRYVVSAPLAGRLSRIQLREGDEVSVDQVLATLTPVLPTLLDDRTLGEQRARVESALANVERAQSRIARAQVALEQARNAARRSVQLAQQGFISAAKLEEDQLAVRAAQREVDAAQADRNVASFELEQARAALGAVRVSPGRPDGGESADQRFEVRSPIAGRVLRVLQPSAGTVALGTPLLELGDTRRLEIVAELLTTDALAATPGSRVIIDRWGGQGTLAGRVVRVEPAAFTKVSALGVEEQRVRVLIEITSPRERWQALGDGFRVSVKIVRIAVDDALVVPVSAVFPVATGKAVPNTAQAADDGVAAGDASPAFAVFRVIDGRAVLTPVAVGARDAGQAWIRSGLEAGAQVIVYPPAGVEHGVRVSERST